MSPNDSEQGQHPGIDDKTRKLKYWGLGLTLLGLGVQVFTQDFWFLIGMGICGVGLACYAKAKGRHIAWCVGALLPVLGPIIAVKGIFDEGKRSGKGLKRQFFTGIGKVALAFVLVIALFVGPFLWNEHKVDVFYASAKDGMPLVEALEKHGGWQFISFRPCGSVYNHSNKQFGAVFFSLDPVSRDPIRKESTYQNLRDIFQAEPQVFTKCPYFSVVFYIFMFRNGFVDVQVDAQGKIVLAKEPRYSD